MVTDDTNASVQALVERWAGAYRGSDSKYDALVEALLDERERLREAGEALRESSPCTGLRGSPGNRACWDPEGPGVVHTRPDCRTVAEKRWREVAALTAPSGGDDG